MTGEQAEMAVLDSQTHDDRNNEPVVVDVGGINDLVLVVKGEIVETNFQEVATQIKSQVSQINEDLKTDADFESAKTIAANLRAATKKMAEVKANALAEAEELYATFKSIDDVSATCIDKAKALEKTIATRKEKLKKEILEAADLEICGYMREQSDDFQNQRYTNEIYTLDGLNACIYRKSSFSKMNEALAEYVTESKKRVDEHVALLSSNAEMLDRVDDEYKDLFLNRNHLLRMAPDLLESTIEQYIQTHKANELQRKVDEQAEKDKIAEEKAENDRIAAEAQKQKEVETDDSMVDQSGDGINGDTLVSVEHTATNNNLDDDDDLSMLDEPVTKENPGVEHRPNQALENSKITGSPVPVVKSKPKAKTVAHQSQETIACYEVTVSITSDLSRAQQIARITHGRLKNMPEVQRVGLKDIAKQNNLIETIIQSLKNSNENKAVETIQQILEQLENG